MKKIGEITESKRKLLLGCIGQWSHCKGEKTDYWNYVIDSQTMYIKLEPGGFVHPHTDSGYKIHTVLQTNPDCYNRVGDENYRLELCGVYRMDASQEHASFNHGYSDRIHMVESFDA